MLIHHKHGQLKVRDFSLSIKASDVADDGSFSGYGSVFNVVDKGGDIVAPGAFAESLAAWKKAGRSVPVLWQHQTDQPIGAWDDLKEDGHGLLGDASLWLEEARKLLTSLGKFIRRRPRAVH